MNSIDILERLASLGMSQKNFSITLVEDEYSTQFKITLGEFSYLMPTFSANHLLSAYVNLSARIGVKGGWIRQ